MASLPNARTELLPNDLPRRLRYSNWFLTNAVGSFLQSIIIGDEAGFALN